MLNNYIKDKKVLTYIVIGLLLTSFIITGLSEYSSRKRNRELTESEYNFDYIYSPEKNLQPEEMQEELVKLEEFLPIYISDYQTSVGITTYIGIYRFKSEPEHYVRVEINNIDYYYIEDKTTLNSDKNVIAFKESFNKAISVIKENGVDPKKLYYVFGTKAYINEIAASWVEELELLK